MAAGAGAKVKPNFMFATLARQGLANHSTISMPKYFGNSFGKQTR